MGIRYRACHTNAPWRKVNHHKAFESAVDGKDGAVALLNKKGRIADRWQQYGDVLGVAVWDTEQVEGVVLRLNPVSGEVERRVLSVLKFEAFDDTGGITPSQMESIFSASELLVGVESNSLKIERK